MNLVLALTDQGIGSNIILGFDKSKANEVLDIEDRFRPELLITVGYTDENWNQATACQWMKLSKKDRKKKNDSN